MGRFLSQVSAPNIRTIEFAFDSSPRGRKYPLLKRLQQVTAPLSSHVFRDLERVIIRLCDWTKLPVNEDVFQKIKRDLADFDVRQMLEIKLDRVNVRLFLFAYASLAASCMFAHISAEEDDWYVIESGEDSEDASVRLGFENTISL